MRTSVDRLARRWFRAGIENGKLDNNVRKQANIALVRAGLDGNGRFAKIGFALNAAFDVLAKFGIEPDEIVNAFSLSRPSGTYSVRLAFTNTEDSFSPVSIHNSVLHFSWTDLGTRFDVVAYLS